MTDHERIELALGLVELWNAGTRGAETIARFCDPEVELRTPFSR